MRTFSARVSHRLNTVDQSVENIRVAVESDPTQYKESLAEQLTIIDALEVSPEVKEAKRMQAIETVSVAAVQGEIRDDAEAALNALNAKPGKSGNLAVEALTLTARRALRNEAESILRQRDAATTAAKTRARALISDARSRMEAGYALPDAELGAINGVLDMAQDPDIENDWNELRGVQAFLGSFQKLAPSQMRSVIDGELSPAANDKGATRLEFLALNAAESALNRQNTAINQGRGLSYALQTGIVSDIGDISTQEGRQLRAAVSGSLDARFGLPQQPLLPEEVAEISASLVDMPVTEKLAMGMQLANDMGDKGFDAIAQIGDNVYQYAVGLSLASPAHEVVALDILAGQQMLRENKELAPAKTDIDLSLSQFMPAFKNLPEQGAMARQAAVAHYVKTSAWDDSWTLEKSFQAVLGSGVGEYNGAQIVLPVSVDEGDFEDAIAAMKDDDLAALSLSSAPRYQDGQMAKAEDIADDAELESVGSGQYIVRMPNGYLVDDQGEFYVLSLDAERVNRLKNAPSDRSVSGFRAISPDSVEQ